MTVGAAPCNDVYRLGWDARAKTWDRFHHTRLLLHRNRAAADAGFTVRGSCRPWMCPSLSPLSPVKARRAPWSRRAWPAASARIRTPADECPHDGAGRLFGRDLQPAWNRILCVWMQQVVVIDTGFPLPFVSPGNIRDRDRRVWPLRSEAPGERPHRELARWSTRTSRGARHGRACCPSTPVALRTLEIRRVCCTAVRRTPKTFVSNCRRKSASVSSSKLPVTSNPALATTTSMRPKRSRASATA